MTAQTDYTLVIRMVLTVLLISAIATPLGRRDRASCRFTGLSSSAWPSLLADMRLLLGAETFIPSGSDHRYVPCGEPKGLFLPRFAGVTEETGRRHPAVMFDGRQRHPPGPGPAHRLTPDILRLRNARGAQASR